MWRCLIPVSDLNTHTHSCVRFILPVLQRLADPPSGWRCYREQIDKKGKMSEKHKHTHTQYTRSVHVFGVCMCIYRRNSESQCWSENLDTVCTAQPNVHCMSGFVMRSQQQHHISLSLLRFPLFFPLSSSPFSYSALLFSLLICFPLFSK